MLSPDYCSVCAQQTVKYFHSNRTTLRLILYEQVLEGIAHIQDISESFSCHVAASFCGSPNPCLSQSPTSTETNATSPPQNYRDTCIVCVCVCVCTCSTAYIYVSRKGGVVRLTLHIFACLFKWSLHWSWWPAVSVIFLGEPGSASDTLMLMPPVVCWTENYEPHSKPLVPTFTQAKSNMHKWE